MRKIHVLVGSSLIAIGISSAAQAQTASAQQSAAQPEVAAAATGKPTPSIANEGGEGFKNVVAPNVPVQDLRTAANQRALPRVTGNLGIEQIDSTTGALPSGDGVPIASGKKSSGEVLTTQALRSSGATAPLLPTSVTELARALKNDPDLIYEFVRDNIELYPVYGVSKGWRGALIDRQGSNYDQAELMVNLLRAAGYTASYVAGVATLSPVQVQSFYGIDISKGCNTQNFFSAGQIPNNRLLNAGDTCDSPFRGITINHVWVQVNISGTNYVFDPSLKAHSVKAGIDVKAASAYDQTAFMNAARTGATVTADAVTNINRANIRSSLNARASSLVSYLRANKPAADLDDVLGGKTITPTDACFPAFVQQSCLTRQTSLPYATPQVLWTGDIPNQYRVLLRVTLQSPNTSVPGIDQLLLADFFYGKRLSIASDATLRPVLMSDGVALATGNPVPAGTAGLLTVEVVHGGYQFAVNDQTISRGFNSGETRNLMVGLGPSTSALPAIYRAQAAAATAAGGLPGDEAVLGSSLAALGGDWLGQTSMSSYIADRLGKANTLQHHTLGFVSQQQAPTFDIPGIMVSTVQEQGSADLSRAVYLANNLHYSAFEAGVLEQVTGQPTMSTVSVVDRAVLGGQPIYKATSTNYTSVVRPNLVNCSSLDSTFSSFVSSGFNLYLPQSCTITQNSWTGYGYLLVSQTGGTVGSFIDGVYAGGLPSVQLLPSDWGVQSRTRRAPWGTRDQKQRGDPVDVATGAFSYGHDDMSVGIGGFPTGLGFQKLYNSGSAGNDGPLGRGWTHNLSVTVKPDSAPWQGLGEDSPFDAASTIAETMIAIDLLSDAAMPVDKVTTTLLGSRWYADQLLDNAAVMTGGINGQTFIKLPDGTYNPGPASSARLTQAGDGTYVFSNVNKETYSFDATGNVLKWASPTGLEVRWAYTGGLLTGVSNSLGRSLMMGYTGSRITSVSDGTGRSVGYGYDIGGNLTSFTNASGKLSTFEYDQPGRLKRYFLPANPVAAQIVNTYDSLGRISQQIDSDNQTWNYYVAGSRTEVDTPKGRRLIDYFNGAGDVAVAYDNVDLSEVPGTGEDLVRVRYDYDGRGRITRITDTLNPMLEFTYDDVTCNGLEKRCTNNITIRRRRGIRALTDVENSPAQLSTFTFEPNFNKVATSNDSGPVTFNYTYDSTTGNQTSSNSGTNSITGAGTPTSTTYGYASFAGAAGFPAFTLPTSETRAISASSAVTTNFTYNAVNRYVPGTTVVDPGGLAITNSFTYDSVGNITSLNSARTDVADITAFGYDAERRLTSVTDALGKQSLNAYNDDGDLIRSTSQFATQWMTRCLTALPSGKTSRIIGPSLVADNLSCPTAAAPVPVTDMAYDGEGRLASLTVNRTVAEGGPKTTTFKYSPSGTRLVENNAVGTSLEQRTLGIVNSAYQLDQRLPNNATWSYQKDGHNHVVISGFDCTPGLTPDSGCEQPGYTSNDILSFIRTRDAKFITFAIDGVSNLRTSKTVPAVSTQIPGRTINYAYDALARQTSAAITGGNTATATYDKGGRITSTTASGRTVAYQYDPAGNRTRVTWPDTAFFVTYGYDALNRLSTAKEGTTTSLATYSYDDLSRVTGIAFGNGTSKSMTYNAQGKLGTLTHDLAGTTGDVTRTFAYDQSGAQISVLTSNGAYDWNGHYNVNRNYTNDGIFAYLTTGSKTLTYDQRGNVIGDGTWTFTYDLENNLLTAVVKSGANLTYSYDALNRLASRKSGTGGSAVLSNYLYDGMQRLGEYSSTGALQRRYIPGASLDEPLVIYDGTNAATKTWLYGDERGSITAAANATGTLVTAYSYGPFGEPNATAGVALRYTGQMLDPASGLYYYRARWYSPYLGRFLSPDPIGLDGGTHLYRYTGNDPLNFTDPLGLQKQDPNESCGGYGDALSIVGAGASYIGDGATLLGVAATATVIGAEAGIPLASAGKVLSIVGSVSSAAGDACKGNYGSAAGNLAGIAVNAKVGDAINGINRSPFIHPITRRFVANPLSGPNREIKKEIVAIGAEKTTGGLFSIFDDLFN